MSPERKAAVEALEQALDALAAVVDSEDPDPFGGIRTGWIVVSSRTKFEDDGGSSTGLRVYMPDTMADWQQVGLLRAGQLMIEADFASWEV